MCSIGHINGVQMLCKPSTDVLRTLIDAALTLYKPAADAFAPATDLNRTKIVRFQMNYVIIYSQLWIFRMLPSLKILYLVCQASLSGVKTKPSSSLYNPLASLTNSIEKSFE